MDDTNEQTLGPGTTVIRPLVGPISMAVIVLMLTLSVGLGAAQGPSVRIEGRVLWIAADTMVVAPYADSAPIKVDLSKVDQDEYMRLATDDSVTVTGTVSNERDRVIATSIQARTP